MFLRYGGFLPSSLFDNTKSILANASGEYLVKSDFGAASDGKKGTVNYWFYANNVGTPTTQAHYAANSSGTNADEDSFNYVNGGSLQFTQEFAATIGGQHRYTQALSTSTWYQITVQYDRSNGTTADRMKFFVNGTEITPPTVDAGISDVVMRWAAASNQSMIGATPNDTSGQRIDGLIHQFSYCDGQLNAPSAYASGGLPIDISGLTFGNNGFWLQFLDSGDLGADSSGNDNHFTNNGVTQSTTVPT